METETAPWPGTEFRVAKHSPVKRDLLPRSLPDDGYSAVADQDKQLPVCEEAELQQPLAKWNQTTRDYPIDRCVDELLEAQVERTPDAIAVVYECEQLTYRELNERSNRLAEKLRRWGVASDVLVGICVERSLDMVVGMLGILKAGGAYLPLDPTFPTERLAFMIEDARPRVLVTQARLSGSLPESEADVLLLDQPAKLNDRQPSLRNRCSADLAYVIYTSGSTGRPKGVQISHRSLVNLLMAMREQPGLSERDALLAVTTLSFDIAGLELLLPLLTGARVVVAKREDVADGRRLMELIAHSQATVMQATPATWRLLLEAGWQGNEHLKVLCGGETLPTELARQLLSRCASLWNLYGPTETTIWSAACQVQRDQPIAIGRPIANTQFYILDCHLRPVPIGVTGELFIGGDGLARGYLNRVELTAEKFILNPFCSDGGMRLYRTGDRARFRPDGMVELLGRVDQQVKIRGFRIELGEIEAVLEQHPLVSSAVLMVREDERGEKQLIAYVMGKACGQPLLQGELRTHLRKQLPEYMLPAVIMVLDSLPLTPNGKIDRNALPLPVPGGREGNEALLTPRDSIEAQLAGIWERIFKVTPIGVRDNFFDLGGHSLLAVRLFVEIEKLTGKHLPLVTLFQSPTIEHLATLLRQSGWEAPWESLVPIKPGGTRPPLYCVHGVGGNILEFEHLGRYMDAEQPLYGIQAQGLDGNLPRHDTVEEMAAHYVKEIRAFQPEGPYYLAGSSFGGMVAFEMAQQLVAQGQIVALLGMFDTYAHGYPRFLPSHTGWKRRLSAWRNRFDLHWHNLRIASMDKKIEYIRAKTARLVYRFRIEWRKSVGRLQYRWQDRRVPAELRAVRQAGHSAASNYRPKPYPGKVTLLRASKQPRGIVEDPMNGWGPLALGNVEVHVVPGHHGAIVREPCVPELARCLSRCLRRAQERVAVDLTSNKDA